MTKFSYGEKMKDIDPLKFDLDNLKKLHEDLEKQMLRFDEVVPFGSQRTAQIYSPRLLNMMLVCGAQIEAIIRLIARRCDFSSNTHDPIPPLIRKINEKSVLSKFTIVSILHQVLFTPFVGRNFQFWDTYTDLKHELKDKQFKITYTTVMDAFAALSAFHYLASKLMICFDNDIPEVLDSNNWKSDNEIPRIYKIAGKHNESPIGWEQSSLLFEIRTIYKPF